MLLLQWGLSSLGFCSVSSDNFFVFRCTWLVLTQSWYFFVYILFKKDIKLKNNEIFWKKVNSLKKGEWVPLLNFRRVVPGPRVPRSWVPGPGVLVPLLHHASNAYLKVTIEKKWHIRNFDSLNLKSSSSDQFMGSPNSCRYHWIFKLLVAT